MSGAPIDRRTFITGLMAGTVVLACGSDNDSTGTTTSGAPNPTTGAASASTTTNVPLTRDPFIFGVASGDPTPSAVILWTRLDGDDLGDVPVSVEVSRDEAFSEGVWTADVVAGGDLGHTIHVDAIELDPATSYFYRFHAGEFTSATGRTRTLPDGNVESWRFAFSSCQNWEQGFYAAHRHLAAEDLDAFVWLGDYIYEYGPGVEGVRRYDTPEIETLDDYRTRYALHKSDADLQACHAAFPWISTWDDHEVDNNYANLESEDGADPAQFSVRRAVAYQAWYENLPVRLDPPTGPDYEIYRRVDIGELLSFYVVDTRQHRSGKPASEPIEIPVLGPTTDIQPRTELLQDPDRTMLGDVQEAWLRDELAASKALWNVLAQQVFVFGAQIPLGEQPLVLVDTWDGFEAARTRLVESLAIASNPIILTGDFHSAGAGDVRSDPYDMSLPVMASEFMASSISSQFFDRDDPAFNDLVSAALGINQQIKFFDTRRGYIVCDVGLDKWTSTYRAVSDGKLADADIATIATFVVQSGTPGVVAS